MTTSGTVGRTVIDVATLIDHAFRRAGVSPADQTPDSLIAARQNLYFYLQSLGNTGINLWTVEKEIVGNIQGQANYNTGIGTIDLRAVLQRTISNASGGTAASSNGGFPDNAFDSDAATFCTQNAINGNISYVWPSQTTITTIGILPHGNQNYNLVWETSDDSITWTEVYATGRVAMEDRQWYCYDIDSPRLAYYFRVRETGGAILDVRQLVFATIQLEIPIARMNADQYYYLTTKTMQSSTVPQYWFNRKVDNPEIIVWPIPNSFFTQQFVLWRWRQIQDVGTLTNTLEIPDRWIESAVTELACRMVLELPKVDTQRYGILKAEAAAATALAQQEERDKSPIMIGPNISCYTR